MMERDDSIETCKWILSQLPFFDSDETTYNPTQNIK